MMDYDSEPQRSRLGSTSSGHNFKRPRTEEASSSEEEVDVETAEFKLFRTTTEKTNQLIKTHMIVIERSISRLAKSEKNGHRSNGGN